MRTVTVTAAVMAILVSAFSISLDIDHRLPSTRLGVISVADIGAINDLATQPAPDTKCLTGDNCRLMFLPTKCLALIRFDSESAFSHLAGYLPFLAPDVPFHPPRILSQV
jgi:hypothetical protein